MPLIKKLDHVKGWIPLPGEQAIDVSHRILRINALQLRRSVVAFRNQV